MQYRTLRRVVLSFVVMIVAVGSLTLLGCGGDDADSRIVGRQTIPLNAASAVNNNTEVVEGKTFVVSGNTLAAGTTTPALATALRGPTGTNTPSLTFTSINGATGTFTTTNPTTNGTVTFTNSCTFAITAPDGPPPIGEPDLRGTIFIQDCTVTVTSNGLEVELGGAAVTGLITLTLNGSVSSADEVEVQLDDNGQLIVDGEPVDIVVTGTSGG